VPNGKLVQKYFHVVKVTQYVLYEEDRTPTLLLKLGNPFSQTSGFVPGRQNR